MWWAYLHKGRLGSLRYRFCYRFGAWCNLDFFVYSALKNGRWFTLCLSGRDCSFGGPGDTPCCSLCEDVSLKPQIETCQGISTTIIGGYRSFFFLIVLQWFADAPRKTDMRILIPWVGGFYNLSSGSSSPRALSDEDVPRAALVHAVVLIARGADRGLVTASDAMFVSDITPGVFVSELHGALLGGWKRSPDKAEGFTSWVVNDVNDGSEWV